MKEELRIRIRLRLAAAGLRRAGREAVVVRHDESVSPLRPDRWFVIGYQTPSLVTASQGCQSSTVVNAW